MIILSWNIRGFKDKNEKRIQQKFGNNWCWVSNYEHHRKGRECVGWRREIGQVDIVGKHTQFIAIQITSSAYGKIMVVFIYGLHTVTDRKDL